MTIESENSVVSIEYELREKGSDEVLDSNIGSRPLEFIMGKGSIIPGLEKGLTGMKTGESKKITVEAAEAYGEKNPEAIKAFPIEQFEGIDLQRGMSLYGEGEDGQTVQVTVVDFDDKEVTVDFNHPLAGKVLEFDVTVIEARPATEEEISTCMVGGTHCADGSCGYG